MNVGILLMAGRSERMEGREKQFYTSPCEAVPLYVRPLKTLADSLDDVVIVASKENRKKVQLQTYAVFRRFFPVLEGGKTRTESVKNALEYIRAFYGEKGVNVLVHDAARPFVPKEVVERVKKALERCDAATAAWGVSDSLLREEKGRISYVSRDFLHSVQTPQGFSFPLLWKAYRGLEAESLTDDFQLVLGEAESPALVEGSPLNFKVTRRGDLPLYDALALAESEALKKGSEE